VVERQTRAA